MNSEIPNNTLNHILETKTPLSTNYSLADYNITLKQKFLTSNYFPLNQHASVLKKITLKGFGKSPPSNDQEVSVNYFCELEDGKSIDNTLILREPKKIILGKNQIIPGLELAIKTMLIGEKAKVIVFPEMGYLIHENFTKNKIENFNITDFPTLQDSKNMEVKDLKNFSAIFYEIELVKFDKPRKNRENIDLDEKISEANDLKNLGNQLFRESRFREALIKYESALFYFFKIPTQDLLNKLNDLKQSIILNIVNCHISLLEFSYALKRVSEAFEIKASPKCYFYRAVSNMNLGDFEQAKKDVEVLKDLMPNDNQVKNLEKDFYFLKDKITTEKKVLFKKVFFSNHDNDKEKNNKKINFPVFDMNNFCFYFDFVVNKNFKNPQKIKFEIFDFFERKKIENNKNSDREDFDCLYTVNKTKSFNFLDFLNNGIKEKFFIGKIFEINKNSEEQNFIFFISEINFENFSELEKNNEDNLNQKFLDFLNFDIIKHKIRLPPAEDFLLGLKIVENKKVYLVLIPYKLSEEVQQDLYIIGRLFYNKENFKILSDKINSGENLEIEITNCDKSFI